MEGDRDILSSHAGLFDKQLGGAGKERGFLFGRAPATEKDLDDQHSVRAGDVEIFGIIDEAPAAVLGDDLKLIALRHAEAFDHGAMNGIANRGELFIGTTLEDIDSNERHRVWYGRLVNCCTPHKNPDAHGKGSELKAPGLR